MSQSISASAEAAGHGSTPWKPSRRWFLGGAAAVVLGGAAGTGAEIVRRRAPGNHQHPPATLLDAIETERRLIADLDATTGGTPAVRQTIRQARANHAAHLAALTAAATATTPATNSRSTKHSTLAGAPRTRAQLAAAEHTASLTAAARAERLAGAHAALLASIAACEATHAELLA